MLTALMLIFTKEVIMAVEICPTCGAEIPPVITTQVEKNLDGSMKKWTEISPTGKRVDSYTYYKGCEIDVIVQERLDSKSVVVNKTDIKHFTDGKPPVVTNVDIKEIAEVIK